jgi:biotin carboxyl carrier protein
MEAPRAGKVREIKVSEGQAVQEGDTVAVLD